MGTDRQYRHFLRAHIRVLAMVNRQAAESRMVIQQLDKPRFQLLRNPARPSYLRIKSSKRHLPHLMTEGPALPPPTTYRVNQGRAPDYNLESRYSYKISLLTREAIPMFWRGSLRMIG